MNDKQPVQAAGDHRREGAPDGVEDASEHRGGGQSEGGAYPNPHAGHGEKTGGFLGHGGQSHIRYSGPGDDDDPDGNPNSVTGGD